MSDREKLIELLKGTPDVWMADSTSKILADNLVSNGVTVRERGRWEDEHGGKYANPRYRCPVCKGRALYKFERDLLDNWKEVQALTDFCPNCGADMRGEEDGK